MRRRRRSAIRFTVTARCAQTAARLGRLELPHASVETPVFMPVGTQATVKGMTPGDLEGLGFRLILGNTYHLHLRPGEDLIERAGGLHRFAGWDGALLTDSGGFQVFSLARLRQVTDDGVRFQSHIDGSTHLFTPESTVEIQRKLGADIAMALDECVPNPCEREAAERALERTQAWAARCLEAHHAAGGMACGGWPQALFAIVQGATYRDLRERAAGELGAMPFPGYAIGGLAVGEDAATRNACVEWSVALLPADRPRYLMGVGYPLDIVDAVERGVDMFDCVLPTRSGRTAQAFTSRGTINLRNAAHAEDFGPLDPECDCAVCARHSRAYVRHLFQAGEMLAARLTTYHNLSFYAGLLRSLRSALQEGRFPEEATLWRRRLSSGAGDAVRAPAGEE